MHEFGSQGTLLHIMVGISDSLVSSDNAYGRNLKLSSRCAARRGHRYGVGKTVDETDITAYNARLQ
jgi:hypothetical protein